MRAVVFGATSGMAIEFSRLLAEQGFQIHLVGRKAQAMAYLQSDLKVRGAQEVSVTLSDLEHTATHQQLVDEIFSKAPVHYCLVAYGMLGNQKQSEVSWAEAERVLHCNFTSYVSLLHAMAPRFESQKFGVIGVISSVAGDRGRQSNYVYGSAKGGLSIFLEGLRNRLFFSNVHVVTIKPGFVKTRMTAHLKQSPLVASASSVASMIWMAMQRKREVAYVPGFWRAIMLIIRVIPEGLFKRPRL